MATEPDDADRLEAVLARDPRYPRDAYVFLLAGLERARQQREGEDPSRRRRHLRAGELLEALRDLALDEFGPLAYRVLSAWGIRRTEDFGRLVYNLVDVGLVSVSPDDSPADFCDGFDFATAFREPFERTGDMPTDLPPVT